jgi:dipeptidyl-peptidase-4
LKKILLIIGFGMILIALFATAFYFLSVQTSPLPQNGNTLTLEDILYGRLQASRFNATWVDDTLVYRDLEGNFLETNVTSGKTSTILDTSNENLAEGFKFELSADNRYLLVGQRMQKVNAYFLCLHSEMFKL